MVPAQPVGQPEDERRPDDHGEQREQRQHQPAVHGMHQGRGQMAGRAQAAAEQAGRSGRGGDHPQDPQRSGVGAGRVAVGDHTRPVQFIVGPEQRDPVTRPDRVIPARADHHVAAVGRQHRDRGQGPVDLTEGARAGGHGPRGGEPLAGQPDLLDPGAHAGFRDRRGGQPGHVQHGHLDPGTGPADGRVAELDHHPHIGAQFPGQQGRLQRVQVILQRADDRRGAGQPGFGEDLRGPGTAGDVRHPPADEAADQPHVRIVVHDHRRDPGEVQLLNDPQANPVQPADDHVAVPARVFACHPAHYSYAA